MRIPMKVDYGVRALVELAQRDGNQPVRTAEIAKKQHIPEPYLDQVLTSLNKFGFIHSRRGPSGGHVLAKPPEQISLGDIMTKLEGRSAPLDCIEQRTDYRPDLSRINFEDNLVYDMLCEADTIGIFQVESAAQMQTIIRIRPRNLTDMAHEVAAVRPGVGVNDAVTEYIARRNGRNQVRYDHDLEKRALQRTLGVILFQDQVLQVVKFYRQYIQNLPLLVLFLKFQHTVAVASIQ